MVKSNPNMSRFLGVVRQDLLREEGKDEISAQITGRSVNMMEFSRMIEKLRYVHTQQQREKDNWNKKPEFKVNIQYDKSTKNIGVLIKLNDLMKRLELVKHLTGDWKSTNNKYSTITEQVKYVRKKLELLDEAKILFLQNRAEKLNQEVKATWQATQQDAQQQLIDKRAREFGHSKEIIDQLYKNGKGVLPIAEQVPNIVDRLEQKRKVQDMAAHIFVTIERMETQQQAILK